MPVPLANEDIVDWMKDDTELFKPLKDNDHFRRQPTKAVFVRTQEA